MSKLDSDGGGSSSLDFASDSLESSIDDVQEKAKPAFKTKLDRVFTATAPQSPKNGGRNLPPRQVSNEDLQLPFSPVEAIETDEFLAKLSYLRKSVQDRLGDGSSLPLSPSTAPQVSNLPRNCPLPVNEDSLLDSSPSHELKPSTDQTLPKSGGTEKSNSSKSDKQTIPASVKSYIENGEAVELAKSLFKEDLEGFSRSIVSPIIGTNDAFHKKVLIAYMECFDFSKVSLDEAFRLLCVQLQLGGETQAIDRILFQMSLRFWETNENTRKIYKSVDIVYGTLFSIVLLNTDLHTANVGARHSKKMSLRMFIKNTMSLFDDMIAKDKNVSALIGGSVDAVKLWKRDFEAMLKEMYTSILENPIMQNTQTTANASHYRKSTTSSIPTPSSHIRGNSSVPSGHIATTPSRMGGMASQSSASKTFSATFNFLKKDQNKALASQNSHHQIVIEGVLIRKHMVADGAERASNRRWIKVWCCIRISKELGVELHTHRLHSAMGSGTGEKEFVEAEYNIPVQYSDTSKYPACTGANALPVSPFLAAQEKHQESPSSASSQPPAASGNNSGPESSSQVLHINIGKKYHHQITQNSPDQTLPSAASSETGSTSATTSNPSTPSILIGGAGGTPSTPHPLLASPTQDYKLNPNHDPEIFSLIHAFSTPYHYDGTAHPRPHTISIMMANCHVYLFQTPSAVSAEAWIRTINYWAGLRSREPMRGGISNLEYGWSLLKSPDSGGGGGGSGGGPREGIGAAAATDKRVGISAGSEDVLGVESSLSVDSSASPGVKRTNSRPRMQKTNSTDSLKFIGNVLMKRESSAGFAVSFAGDGGSSSISIGASSPIPSTASPVTSGNGNSGSGGSPLLRSMGKSFKLAKWVPEVVSTRLVSNKDEAEQLVCMQRQLEFVRLEIQAHEVLKEGLDNRLSSHPQFQLLLSNWNAKCDALNFEFLKYEAYIQALRNGETSDSLAVGAITDTSGSGAAAAFPFSSISAAVSVTGTKEEASLFGWRLDGGSKS